MSKSEGNTIDPLAMMKEYGTDAMRFTVCAYAILGRNIYLSDERFEGYRNFMNKIWNASRFVMMNTESLDAEVYAAGIKSDELKLEDKWIMSELSRTIQSVNKHLERHTFDAVGHDMYHFIWDSYCDWYLELTKPRLSEENPDARDRQVAQIVLIKILDATLRLLHPVSPFITEELWQKLKEKYNFDAASIMIAAHPKNDDFALDEDASKDMRKLQDIIKSIRKLRAEMNIAPKDNTPLFTGFANDTAKDWFGQKGAKEYIERCIPINFNPGKTVMGTKSMKVKTHDILLQIPLSTEQCQAELVRINKEIPKLEKGLEGISRKLGNEKFVANAKPEVVEKEKKRQQELEFDLKRAQEKFAALS